MPKNGPKLSDDPRFHLRLEPKVKTKLAQIAKKENTSITQILLSAVKLFLYIYPLIKDMNAVDINGEKVIIIV